MKLKNPAVNNNLPQEPYHFKKRIGSITFHVAVHFNPDAKETAQDKIIRLIRNDIAMAGYSNNPLGKVVNL